MSQLINIDNHSFNSEKYESGNGIKNKDTLKTEYYGTNDTAGEDTTDGYNTEEIFEYGVEYGSGTDGDADNEDNVISFEDFDCRKPRRLIVQTWKDENVPDHWRISPISIKKHMPNWDYVLITDEDNERMCKEYFPDFYPHYKKFPHNIQRADACRYMFMAQGGKLPWKQYECRGKLHSPNSKYDLILYMDLDFELLKPLDPLFTINAPAYFVASGNVANVITNSFFAGKPKHDIWFQLIEEMKAEPPSWAYGKHLLVMSTTGPLAFDRVIRKSGIVYGTLPNIHVMPCSTCDIENCDVTNSYLRPLVGGSWNEFDSYAFNAVLCGWRNIVIVCVIIILFLVCLYFSNFVTTI